MDNNNSPLRLVSMPGTEKFSKKVDYYLKRWNGTERSFLLDVEYTRFNTGDGKAVLGESARGKDIFVISDPYNCSVTYNFRGYQNHMSPDDHFQDLKRTISAINGKAYRTSVLMNMLYSARQHARNMRESLDCAMALRELENFQVKNVITFDAHDPKVQNAIPLVSFDNLYPNYQMLKSLLRSVEMVNLSSDEMVIISPDAGGVQRCLKLAEALNLEIGMFYKQRDTAHTVGGNNAIKRHQYIGNDISGKDVIIIDDILATGDSLVDSFKVLKTLGAKRVFSFITFGMFTKGYEAFDRAYGDGLFDKIFISDLTFHEVEGEEKPYIVNVELSKYAAYIINAIHSETSISNVLDPYSKIKELLAKTV